MASFNPMPAMTVSGAGDTMALNSNQFEPNFEEPLIDNVNGSAIPPLPFNPSYELDFANPTFEDPFAYSTIGSYAHGSGFAQPSPSYQTTPQIAAQPSLSYQTTPQIAAQPLPSGAGPHHASRHANRTSRPHTHAHPANAQDDASSPQELDNNPLAFKAPVHKAHLVDEETGQIAEVGMTAELYGMFSVAEDVFAPPGGNGRGSSAIDNDTGAGETAACTTAAASASSSSSSSSSAAAAAVAAASPSSPGLSTAPAQLPGPKPPELTCYRRNLWECSGSITMPRYVRQVVDDQAMQYPIVDLAASITAIKSIDKTLTEIISIPWRSATSASGGNTAEEPAKSATAPPNIPLDLSSAETNMSEDGRRITVTLPVSWKRLQFKHATANNGRRKGLQQHYMVQISLLAKVMKGGGAGNTAATGNGVVMVCQQHKQHQHQHQQEGEWIRIAEISSRLVIVRGRSPVNFDPRREVPLTGSLLGKKKKWMLMSQSSGEQLGKEMSQCGRRNGSTGGKIQGDWSLTQSYGTQAQQSSSPSPSSSSSHARAHKKIIRSPGSAAPTNNHNNHQRPPIPAWTGSSSSATTLPPGATSQPHGKSPPSCFSSSRPPTMTAAINLSLSEDERSSPNRSGSEVTTSPRFASSKTPGGGDGSGAHSGGGIIGGGPHSPVEEVDMLYEYFPLSFDDWSPPVDAIYRPHVVHHTFVPPDIKAQQNRSRAKRYFAAD